MSSSPISHLPTEGPGADDCFRLFRTLQREYIPGLRVEVSWYQFGKDQHGMKIELLDDSAVNIEGKDLVNVWSSKTFGNRLHSISEAQLYDLLILGYRAIDRFFEQGDAFAPVRRER